MVLKTRKHGEAVRKALAQNIAKVRTMPRRGKALVEKPLRKAKEAGKRTGHLLDEKITEARKSGRKVIKKEEVTTHRMIQFAIFLTVFVLLYLLLNYYVFYRLGGMLGLARKYALWFAIAGTLSFPLAQMAERYLENVLSRTLYTLASAWMGVFFLLFAALLIYEAVRLIWPLPPMTAGLVIIFIVSLLTLGAVINDLFLYERQVEIPLANLEKEVRIVQLSDLHIGTIKDKAFLQRVVKRTNAAKPDLVVITGDLVDGSAPLHHGMFDALNGLEAPAYFVTGNHEEYEGVEHVSEILNETKVTILQDEMIKTNGLQLAGVGYAHDKERLRKVLPTLNLDPTRPIVLLYHVPEGMDQARTNNVALMLSGHTHDGQIWPFSLLVRMAFPHIKGLYEKDGMYHYVSPGVGTWGPPMRLGSRNEIVVLRLVPQP